MISPYVYPLMQSGKNKTITFEMIEKHVCEYFNITAEQFHTKRRQHEIVYPRQIFSYLAKELMPRNMNGVFRISKYLKQHHTTVMVSIRRVRNYLCVDQMVISDIQNLTRIIKEVKQFNL